MNLQHIQWKIHFAENGVPDPDQVFRAFNTWIPGHADILVDVADYRHVQDGPVILAVGHYGNTSLDSAGRRPGLLIDRKQLEEGSNATKIARALTLAAEAAQRLEADPSIIDKPIFMAGDLKFVVNDRAVFPNNEASFLAIEGDLKAVLDPVLGSGTYTLLRDGDSRQRFTVHVLSKNPKSVSLDSLAKASINHVLFL